MPTYSQLAAEAVWRAQYVPPLLDSVLIQPLRAFYNLGPSAIGAPGDNNHLYGRHRSRNWDLTSIYCTDRSYGTRDARDLAGDGDWYRACDIGIQGQVLQDASRRLDQAVRAGKLPGLAEWFGTFDGVNVVGWYEGHPSSSDDSHLWHLHVGAWTQYANDQATMRLLFETITGTTPAPSLEEDDDMRFLREPDGSIYIEHGIDDATGNPVLWPITALAKWLEYEKSGRTFVQLPAKLDWQFWTKGSEEESVQITDDQLAEIAAAAKEGAEAGAPSHDELVAAAEEGANLAEDS